MFELLQTLTSTPPVVEVPPVRTVIFSSYAQGTQDRVSPICKYFVTGPNGSMWVCSEADAEIAICGFMAKDKRFARKHYEIIPGMQARIDRDKASIAPVANLYPVGQFLGCREGSVSFLPFDLKILPYIDGEILYTISLKEKEGLYGK